VDVTTRHALLAPAHLAQRQKAARATSGTAGAFGAYVPREEMERVLDSLPPESLLGMLLRTLWQSGARISEALDLKLEDVNYAHGTLRLVTLKRGKNEDGSSKAPVFRLVPVGPDLLGYFGRHAGTVGMKPADKFWPWCRRHAFRLISDAMRAAGAPEPRCHPHAIRHGHAVAALMAGVNLRLLQEQLGHRSIEVTTRYLQFTIEDRKAAYKGVF
jgi:integrase